MASGDLDNLTTGRFAGIAGSAPSAYRASMILLRHCQSEFNLHFTRTKTDPGIADPALTELGLQQAELAQQILLHTEISRILVSPYTRALQTAAPIARARNLKLQVSLMVRERYAFICDIGSPRSLLQRAWPELDFEHLDEFWWPTAAEPHDSVISRADTFRERMASSPDWRTTLVVSHWGFLLALSGISMQNGTVQTIDPRDAPPGPLIWRP